MFNSFVVVIVGGLGSIFGTVVGVLLYVFVYNFSISYLPTMGGDCCGQYLFVLTFVFLVFVLAFRSQGLFGRFA